MQKTEIAMSTNSFLFFSTWAATYTFAWTSELSTVLAASIMYKPKSSIKKKKKKTTPVKLLGLELVQRSGFL